MKDLKMYINGKFVESRSGKWINVLNPSTEEVISRQPEGTIEDVEEALDAARAAQKKWAATPAIERAVYLQKIAAGIRKRKDEFVDIIMREQGKTLAWATTEVEATQAYFDYMASFARHIEGEVIPSDRPNETIILTKRPIGVVAGILPWNFPFFLIARKAGASLIAGCTIVIKPSQLTPENCTTFAEICDEVNLPAGVINIVTGKGSVVGNHMAGSPKVDIVSVTGSVSAGESIMAAAAKNITKVSLELGGKAPAIVFPDADLEAAAQWIIDSRIGNNGQICNNAERVYVHQSIKEEFTKILLRKFEAVKVGDPCADPTVDMGPLVEQRALESVTAKVENAIQQGAKVLCGGHRVGDKGYFYAATLLDNCTQDMDIIHQETFGPVLPIVTFEDTTQVIQWANDVEYGLASSVFTKDLDTATRVCRELEFGETYINREHFEAMQGFHAGVKKSGIGGADGRHGVDEYLVTHVTYLDTHYDQ
ncbi:MAG: aldehyde dehydrogenase [Prevotella sp.]|jgi:lactaldehyde dehydrogenase/glycolaldehyde dehydrogenase|nr:aldehyde dehydrogenase [Prevotella sp.]MCI2081037.1 aldehyde dehydrogenase [Prevotella sp.]MCI2102924.1 aldehyde dehydrogenase [Prevotella sp.]